MIAAAAAAAAVAAVAVAAVLRPTGADTIVITAAARDLPKEQLAPVDAATFDGIVAGFRGRPVVVNVWASWCGPCRVEAPLLDRAAAAYEPGVVFLGVASRDDVGSAAQFLRRYDIAYPNLFDVDGDVRRRLGLRGFPTTYVFDRGGALVATEVGGISEQRLAAIIDGIAADR